MAHMTVLSASMEDLILEVEEYEIENAKTTVTFGNLPAFIYDYMPYTHISKILRKV